MKRRMFNRSQRRSTLCVPRTLVSNAREGSFLHLSGAAMAERANRVTLFASTFRTVPHSALDGGLPHAACLPRGERMTLHDDRKQLALDDEGLSDVNKLRLVGDEQP